MILPFALALALATPPAVAPPKPEAASEPPAATLPPKWPQKAGEAGEDIPGVVAKGTPIYKWSESHSFVEGPACAADGTVYFTDIPANEILRVDPMGAKVVVGESKATNGLFLAKDGTLYGCQGDPGAIVAIDPAAGTARVVCDTRAVAVEGTGTSLGRLNDLVIGDDGGIWFTAPVIGGKREGRAPDAVYFVPGSGGEAVEVVRSDAVRAPNGIHLSPDGKTLYVVPYLSLDVMAYPIEGPGKVGEGRVLYAIPPGTRQSVGGDGLTVDDRGNLFVTIPMRAAVFVLSPDGKPLGMIRFPERVSNCALGGKDGKTLFVTASEGVYAIEVETKRSR
jgi:gluconolactonase